MNATFRKLLLPLAAAPRSVADLVLPRVCAACGCSDVSAGGLCDRCNVALLGLVALAHCPRCGTTVGPNIPIREDGCPGCPGTLPRFARVFRLGPYTGVLRSMIRRFKYRRQDTMLARAARMLARTVAAGFSDPASTPPDLVMPVPMHWRRRLVRGFDHARALGRAVAKDIRLPVGNELVRVRHTAPQVHMPRSARIANVRGAFAVHRGDALGGSHILLLDDVTTTGATANEAARTLLRAGVAQVVLAVIAKSEPPTAYAEHLAQ